MKNIEVLYTALSKQLDLPEKVVRAVYNYYWSKGVKNKMNQLEENAVYVPFIGTFGVSRRKLYGEIKAKIGLIRYYEDNVSNMDATIIEERKEKTYNTLRKLLERRNEIAHLYIKQEEINVRQKLEASINKRDSESRQDSGGSNNNCEIENRSTIPGGGSGDTETQRDLQDLSLSE